jgi:hypothetical protein
VTFLEHAVSHRLNMMALDKRVSQDCQDSRGTEVAGLVESWNR